MATWVINGGMLPTYELAARQVGGSGPLGFSACHVYRPQSRSQGVWPRR